MSLFNVRATAQRLVGDLRRHVAIVVMADVGAGALFDVSMKMRAISPMDGSLRVRSNNLTLAHRCRSGAVHPNSRAWLWRGLELVARQAAMAATSSMCKCIGPGF